MSAIIADFGGLFLLRSCPQLSAVIRSSPPLSANIQWKFSCPPLSAVVRSLPQSSAVSRSKKSANVRSDFGGHWRTNADFGGLRIFQSAYLRQSQPLCPPKSAADNGGFWRTSHLAFLRIIVDESLNWSKHIKILQSKMSRYVGIMYKYKLKTLLPLRARLQIYHSFVQYHINYFSLVWGFSSNSNVNTIFQSRKRLTCCIAWICKLQI